MYNDHACHNHISLTLFLGGPGCVSKGTGYGAQGSEPQPSTNTTHTLFKWRPTISLIQVLSPVEEKDGNNTEFLPKQEFDQKKGAQKAK